MTFRQQMVYLEQQAERKAATRATSAAKQRAEEVHADEVILERVSEQDVRQDNGCTNGYTAACCGEDNQVAKRGKGKRHSQSTLLVRAGQRIFYKFAGKGKARLGRVTKGSCRRDETWPAVDFGEGAVQVRVTRGNMGVTWWLEGEGQGGVGTE
jgi:hypothetical protein